MGRNRKAWTAVGDVARGDGEEPERTASMWSEDEEDEYGEEVESDQDEEAVSLEDGVDALERLGGEETRNVPDGPNPFGSFSSAGASGAGGAGGEAVLCEGPSASMTLAKTRGDSKGSKKSKKSKKDGNAPKKNLTAYMFFSRVKREEVKASYPELKGIGEISKKLGELWKAASEEEKVVYVEMAREDKERYAKEMKRYEEREGTAGETRTLSNKKKRKVKKDRNAPKRNMSSWQFFCKERREGVREALGADASMGDVVKRLGELWRGASDAEKAEYVALAAADKIRYAAEMAAYGDDEKKNDTDNGNNRDDSAEEENYDDLVFTRELGESTPPEGLLMDLLPFQRQFLTFGLQQEHGKIRGGILADEMGMGKTIQAISLILANRGDGGENDISAAGTSSPSLSHSGVNKMDPLEVECHAEVDYGLKYCRATLVVCPLVAVVQWCQEIMNHTVPGALKVAVYQGGKRHEVSELALANVDVVITTYNTLEADFRRALMPTKIACKYCKKKYFPDRLKVHLRFFCGPDAEKSEALAKQQTKKRKVTGEKGLQEGKKEKKKKKKKIELQASDTDSDHDSDVDSDADCADDSASSSWERIPDDEAVREAKAFVGSSGEWDDRAAILAAKMIAAYARAEAKASSSAEKEVSVLHKINWRRIVLDEAHNIKARNTNTSKAVFALNSLYRWCLSGTPLQNRVSELYSLIRFLRIMPYSMYFCSKCSDCMNLQYPFQKTMEEEFVSHRSTCDHCDHGPMAHFCWWNKHVANPISKYGFSGPKGGKAMAVLKHILNQICLRRTKIMEADTLALPPRVVVLRRDAFSPMESDYYEALYTQSKVQFGGYVEAGTVLNNYAHIFDLLIRLRQAANHPYLVVFSNSGSGSDAACPPNDVVSAEPTGSITMATCGLCRDPPEDDPCIASCCGALFCKSCAVDLVEQDQGSTACVVCDRPLCLDLSGRLNEKTSPRSGKVPAKTQSILGRIGDLSNFQSSTKIEALREELYDMLETSPSAKAIVFSQFTSMLDLIHFRLEQCGIKCITLHGGMSLKQREKAINAFQEDPTITVFLMSLKAGGVALNLTCASYAFIMDLWWNSAMQCQAMDRIHRLGQFKPMKCVKFVIEGTIEERILKLQEKKAAVFEATVGGDVNSALRLSEDDFKFLFK